MRLSTLPTAFGEKLVMRIFDPEVLVRNFSDLGFSDEDRTRWEAMSNSPNGIILVTGPTGSGKTTTLYSTLKQLATPEVNVVITSYGIHYTKLYESESRTHGRSCRHAPE